MSFEKPLVSVSMITYGHEAFIKQAVESVLMQQCDFEVELIIADDKSPDNTEKVISDIIKTHPKGHWIRYTKHKENKGVALNFAWSLEEGKGKYIAICEGDDYWTDPNKLQKQIAFLEVNEAYAMCCHASEEVDENGTVYKIASREDDTIDLSTVLREGWFIRTAAIIFRKEALSNGFPEFFKTAYSTDYILQVMILKTGNCKYLSDVMSAYRHHLGGVSQTTNSIQVQRWFKKIALLDDLHQFTGCKYLDEINFHKSNIKMDISFFFVKYPPLIKNVGPYTYFKFLFSKYTVIKLIKKIRTKIKN